MRSTLLLISSLVLVAPAWADDSAPTADQVVSKYIEARGGLDKIHAIKSMRMSVKMDGGQMIVPLTIEWLKPMMFRTDVTLQNMTMTQAYDGKNGWQINPFAGYGGKGTPEAMGPDELKVAEEQADLDGPLVDYKSKGNTVEYAGTEDIDGAKTHKLKVTLKNGDVRTFFIDAETYLEVKVAAKRKIRGTEVDGESYYSDFREVAGVLFPFAMEQGMAGVPGRQKMTIEKIEPNVAIDAARFNMPPKPAEPAAEKAAPPAAEAPKK